MAHTGYLIFSRRIEVGDDERAKALLEEQGKAIDEQEIAQVELNNSHF